MNNQKFTKTLFLGWCILVLVLIGNFESFAQNLVQSRRQNKSFLKPLTVDLRLNLPKETRNVESITLKGIYLGMNFEEVKSVLNLPKYLKNNPDRFGLQEYHLYQMKFLDGRLVSFLISYRGVQWRHIEEFTSAFSQNLGISNNWVKDSGRSILKFSNYDIFASFNGNGAWVLVNDSAWDKTWKKRRDKFYMEKELERNQDNEQKNRFGNPKGL